MFAHMRHATTVYYEKCMVKMDISKIKEPLTPIIKKEPEESYVAPVCNPALQVIVYVRTYGTSTKCSHTCNIKVQQMDMGQKLVFKVISNYL